MEPKKTCCWGLLRRRECLVLTLKAQLLLLLVLAMMALVGMRVVYPFLAVTRSIPGGLLVVEGWAPDWALEAAMGEFRTNRYALLLVTGGAIERGAPLSTYKTYAEQSTAILLKMGMNSNQVQAVPAPPVRQDRTYASAVALRQWLRDHQIAAGRVNLITEGPHARRSRLLFEKALGLPVGIIALQPWDYDSRHWWRSSAGVRTVLSEAIAYGYARFLFRAPETST